MTLGQEAAPRRAGWSRLLEGRAFYLWALTCGLLFHLALAKSVFTLQDRLLAWILLCLALEAARSYARQEGSVAPVLPLVMGQLYVMYGLAQFTQTGMFLMTGPYTPPPRAVTLAMLVVTGAALAFRGAFFWGSRHGHRGAATLLRRFPEPKPSWLGGVIVLGISSAVAGVCLAVWPEAIAPEARNVVHSILSPYLALVLALFFAERWRSLTLDVIGWLLIGALWLSTFVSSMLEPGVVSLYLLFASRWVWGRRLRARWLFVAIAGLLLLNPAKYIYRANIRFRSEELNSIDAVNRRLGDLWSQVGAVWGDGVTEENLQVSANRASALILLAQVVDWVPDYVPYRAGEGLADSFLFLIPRALWNGKPDVSDLVNNAYAVEFQLTTEAGTKQSTIGIWQPIDGYWRFGFTGAIAGLGLYGLILGWLFGRPGRAALPAILGLYFTAAFFQTLASLQNVLASLATMLIGAWIALHAVRMLGQVTSPVSSEGMGTRPPAGRASSAVGRP